MYFVGLPSCTETLQNPAKAGQRKSKKIKEKRLGFPWVVLSELSLFSGLRRPPGQEILFLVLSSLAAWPAVQSATRAR
jgi:heme/copper-type cytochrome/quinol oxidase subunit 3